MKQNDKMSGTDWAIGIICMAVFAIMVDMALINMTPAELIENIKCWIGG